MALYIFFKEKSILFTIVYKKEVIYFNNNNNNVKLSTCRKLPKCVQFFLFYVFSCLFTLLPFYYKLRVIVSCAIPNKFQCFPWKLSGYHLQYVSSTISMCFNFMFISDSYKFISENCLERKRWTESSYLNDSLDGKNVFSFLLLNLTIHRPLV